MLHNINVLRNPILGGMWIVPNAQWPKRFAACRCVMQLASLKPTSNQSCSHIFALGDPTCNKSSARCASWPRPMKSTGWQSWSVDLLA